MSAKWHRLINDNLKVASATLGASMDSAIVISRRSFCNGKTRPTVKLELASKLCEFTDVRERGCDTLYVSSVKLDAGFDEP